MQSKPIHSVQICSRQDNKPNAPLRPPLLVNGVVVNPNARTTTTLEGVEALERIKGYDALAYEDPPALIPSQRAIAKAARSTEEGARAYAADCKEHQCGPRPTDTPLPKPKQFLGMDKIKEIMNGEDTAVPRDKWGIRLPTAHADLCPRCGFRKCVCGRHERVMLLVGG